MFPRFLSLQALGGSTNAVLHTLAIAHEAPWATTMACFEWMKPGLVPIDSAY
jgi:dihydroxyacid dehydratase/phosphogluconate dehydratase